MMKWKNIKNATYYQVSKEGDVRSLDRIINKWNGVCFCNILYKSTVLKTKDIRGYKNVSVIYDNGERKTKQVHRLILETFNPVDNMQNLTVNHIDGIKSNNKLNNLEWMTTQENLKHAIMMGLWKPKDQNGSKNKMAKLTESQVAEILKSNKSTKELMGIYDVSRKTIENIRNKKSWTHVKIS